MSDTGSIKKRTLSRHTLLKLIDILNGEHSSVTKFDEIYALAKQLRIPATDVSSITAIINKEAQQAETNVMSYTDNEDFKAINQWIEYMEKSSINLHCNNELPLMFKVIANTEAHPNPDNVDGVDLSQLYLFISNLMLGHPTVDLKGNTAVYFSQVVKEILDDLSNKITPEEILLAKNFVENDNDRCTNIEHNYSHTINTLNNTSLNPFNFPVDLIKEIKESRIASDR